MKSKLYPILLLLIFATIAKAQEYHVETPGTLQEVIGPGAEELTRIRVTGTLNDQDIAFLHHLCWPDSYKPSDMTGESCLRMVMEKEDTLRTNLRHLDLEDARMVNDALPDEAFSGSYIKDYKLPKTLKKIGRSAFECNVLLKELIIPESVEEIGSNLLTFSVAVEKVRLPDNLKVLNEMLFADCWELREVNIPSKVREIYDAVFVNCPKISPSVATLPETVEILDGKTYCSVRSIEEVVVPKNVRVLRGTYSGVPDLRKVTILTDKLTEIGDDTFYGCTVLEEVNIPGKITRIGVGAFCYNYRLRKINIPSTVTRIEKFAFDSAPLDSIDIPAGLAFIGRNAFCKNKYLKKVYCRPVLPPRTNGPESGARYLPFEGSTDNAILYVPKGSAEAYHASEVFSGFKEIVELEAWQWPTSIDTPTMTSDTYRVYGKDGRLYIEEGDNGSHEPVFVRVYGIGGFLVWNGQISDQATIFLPHGFYIVEIGKTICRISL